MSPADLTPERVALLETLLAELEFKAARQPRTPDAHRKLADALTAALRLAKLGQRTAAFLSSPDVQAMVLGPNNQAVGLKSDALRALMDVAAALGLLGSREEKEAGRG